MGPRPLQDADLVARKSNKLSPQDLPYRSPNDALQANHRQRTWHCTLRKHAPDVFLSNRRAMRIGGTRSKANMVKFRFHNEFLRIPGNPRLAGSKGKPQIGPR